MVGAELKRLAALLGGEKDGPALARLRHQELDKSWLAHFEIRMDGVLNHQYAQDILVVCAPACPVR